MAKKKQRRAEQRKSKKETPTPKNIEVADVDQPVKPALASADRFFTLIGFGVLIILVILVAPYFAHKQDRDFEKTAERTLVQIALEKPAKDSVLTEAALKQLKDLGAYPVDSATQLSIQGGAKQASLRARFKKNGTEGLLSIGFLLKQELSLSSRWHAVSFCRPDTRGAVVAQKYLQALKDQNFKVAYSLSSAAIEDLNSGITLEQFTEGRSGFLTAQKTKLAAFTGAVPLPILQAQPQTLNALWQTSAGELLLELIENPLQCAYAVKIALQ